MRTMAITPDGNIQEGDYSAHHEYRTGNLVVFAYRSFRATVAREDVAALERGEEVPALAQVYVGEDLHEEVLPMRVLKAYDSCGNCGCAINACGGCCCADNRR